MQCRLCGPKAGRAIWGLGHVFEGKLYFTKHIVDYSQGTGSLNPFQNLKLSLLQGLPQRASMCKCWLLFHSC